MSIRPTFDRTPAGGVVVPRRLAGIAAVVLRVALDRHRREHREPMHRAEPELRALVDALAEAHRAPLPSPAKCQTVSASLFTVDEAARCCGMSPRTLRYRISRGQVPGATRIGGRWAIPAASVETLEP